MRGAAQLVAGNKNAIIGDFAADKKADGLAALEKLETGLTEFQALIDAQDKQVRWHASVTAAHCSLLSWCALLIDAHGKQARTRWHEQRCCCDRSVFSRHALLSRLQLATLRGSDVTY